MPKTLAISVYERIQREIVRGTLQPGSKLSEEMLSERYQTSRTPVREALKLLVSDGLAVYVPHSGTLVKQFTTADAIQVFDARIALESAAARLAAQQKHSTEALQLLITIHEELEQLYAAGDNGKVNLQENAFHMEVARLSGNPYLQDYLERNQRIHAVFLSAGVLSRIHGGEGRGVSEMEFGHNAIVRAITAQQPDTAEWVMRLHIEEAKRYYLQSVSQN